MPDNNPIEIDVQAFRTQFGLNLFHERNSRNMSSELLAQKVGIRSEYVNQLEAGRKTPSLDVIVCIANVLGITVNQLLTGTYSAQQLTMYKNPLAAKLALLSDTNRRYVEEFLELDIKWHPPTKRKHRRSLKSVKNKKKEK